MTKTQNDKNTKRQHDKKTRWQKDNITKRQKDKKVTRQNDKMTKWQKDKITIMTKRQKDKRQRPIREFNIVTSGQFRTLAMFVDTCWNICNLYITVASEDLSVKGQHKEWFLDLTGKSKQSLVQKKAINCFHTCPLPLLQSAWEGGADAQKRICFLYFSPFPNVVFITFYHHITRILDAQKRIGLLYVSPFSKWYFHNIFVSD